MKNELLLRRLSSFFVGAFIVATSLLVSCSDDPQPTNESELITTLNLSFQRVDELGDPVGDPLVFTFEDLDGDGSGLPEVDDITLEADAIYQLSIELLDNSTPGSVEDITEEVKEEADEHQLFFLTISNPILLSIEYDDVEGDYITGGDDTHPVGLRNIVTTLSSTGSGSLTVVLVHEPNKNAAGVQEGVYSDLVGGSEDIRVEFGFSVN